MANRITLTCKKCGKEFSWLHTSTIKPPNCPNCTYKELMRGNNGRVATKGIKAKKQANIRPRAKNKGLDKKLDTAWSKLVKLKAGMKCEYCGRTTTLNSHHIYSRGKMSLRWKLQNGICLCVAHHIGFEFSAHKTPIPFTAWLIRRKGEGYITALEVTAKLTKKHAEFEKELLLTELLKEIKEIENENR